MKNIHWLGRPSAPDLYSLGGKNESLAQLAEAGFPVPTGFSVTTTAYQNVVEEYGIEPELRSLLSESMAGNDKQIERCAAEARRLLTGLSMPSWLAGEIDAAYHELEEIAGVRNPPVAVRSSAVGEDRYDASRAGEHDSFLWIRGAETVRSKVQQCWASLYTVRALHYLRRMDLGRGPLLMGVGVHLMISSSAAGVAFTLNPANGDRSVISIEAAWGLGTAVVDGAVTPDNFLVDKVSWQVLARTISRKAVQHMVLNDRVITAPVEEAYSSTPCLTDSEVIAVAKIARRVEKVRSRPQDIEWAIDPLQPENANVVLLQARPETIWSRRPQIAVPAEADTFRSIAESLRRHLT
jgi:pyruvate,water dikinase